MHTKDLGDRSTGHNYFSERLLQLENLCIFYEIAIIFFNTSDCECSQSKDTYWIVSLSLCSCCYTIFIACLIACLLFLKLIFNIYLVVFLTIFGEQFLLRRRFVMYSSIFFELWIVELRIAFDFVAPSIHVCMSILTSSKLDCF